MCTFIFYGWKRGKWIQKSKLQYLHYNWVTEMQIMLPNNASSIMIICYNNKLCIMIIFLSEKVRESFRNRSLYLFTKLHILLMGSQFWFCIWIHISDYPTGKKHVRQNMLMCLWLGCCLKNSSHPDFTTQNVRECGINRDVLPLRYPQLILL